MLNVTLRLREFLDGDPVDNCRVRAVVRVVPRFKVQKPRVELGDVPAPVPAAAPVGPGDGSGGSDLITVLEPDFSREERTPAQQVLSGADGVVRFNFDVDDAFQRVAEQVKGGEKAADVAAYLEVDARCAGMARRLTMLSFPQGADGRLDKVIVFDFAKAIVGHTTTRGARLWFQVHSGAPASHHYLCDIHRADAAPGSPPLQTQSVDIERAVQPHAGTLDVAGLDPDTRYRFRLRLQVVNNNILEDERVLVRGEFNTVPTATDALTFAFGSCHLPTAGNNFPTDPAALNRWRALANRDDYELLLLMGDQIYGDSIETYWPTSTWEERYINRYNQLWSYGPMREVLRRTPTYMTMDDHEVDDDWGTAFTDVDGSADQKDQIAAALKAYDAFQHAHNPPTPDGQYHFSLRRGPAAFFVMDSRTHRGKDPEFPVMGREQFQDFRRWATSDETRQADVIFFVTGVPLALLPVQVIIDLLDALEPTAVSLGVLIGAGVGGLLGGPVGATVGAFIGGAGAAVAYDELEEELPTALDLADQWTIEGNQVELERVLDVLFDLANDIRNGQPGPRPRAVFVLGGDAHSGWMHLLRSQRAGGGHDHRRNPFIYHLTSSGISRPPLVSGKNAARLRALVGPAKDIGEADFLNAGFKPDMLPDPRKYVLDSKRDGHYAAEFLGLMLQRNFGRLKIERVGSGRRYRFYQSVEGRGEGLVQLFEVDLDADQVKPRSLIGQVLSTEGRVTQLRLNQVGTGFGPPADKLDAEVIVGLDTEPGRGFGFQLRDNGSLGAQRRMLDLLRDAFNQRRRVRIDYERTGPRNGQVLRVMELD